MSQQGHVVGGMLHGQYASWCTQSKLRHKISEITEGAGWGLALMERSYWFSLAIYFVVGTV